MLLGKALLQDFFLLYVLFLYKHYHLNTQILFLRGPLEKLSRIEKDKEVEDL